MRLGKLFGKSFPKPLQKLFDWDGTGFRSCNSGASNGSDPISEKIARDLVTSAQWDVLLELFVIFLFTFI